MCTKTKSRRGGSFSSFVLISVFPMPKIAVASLLRLLVGAISGPTNPHLTKKEEDKEGRTNAKKKKKTPPGLFGGRRNPI